MAKASDGQSQYTGQERCESPSGGGEKRELSEHKPQDIAQVEAEYKNKLLSDLAQIERKYKWTDPAHNKDDVSRRQEKDRFKAAHRGDGHRSVKNLEILLVTGINEASRNFTKAWIREAISYQQKAQQINEWQIRELSDKAAAAGKQKLQDDKDRDKEFAASSAASLSSSNHYVVPENIAKKYADREAIRDAYVQVINKEYDKRVGEEKAASLQRKRSLTESYDKSIVTLRKRFMTGTFEIDAPVTAVDLSAADNFTEARRIMDADHASTRFVLLSAPPPKSGVTIVTYVDPKVHAELGWIKNLSDEQKQTYQAHQITYPFDNSGNVIKSDIQCGAKVNATCKVNGKSIVEIQDGKLVNGFHNHGETTVTMKEEAQLQRPVAFPSLAEALKRGPVSSSQQRLEESKSRSPSIERG